MDPVGGKERLVIELGARVHEPRIAPRELLQAVEVGGRDDASTPLHECLEHRLREGGPLPRLRPLAHLVDDDERTRTRFIDDAGQVRHARRERGEPRAEILLVPDVGKDPVEERHRASHRTRHVQARSDREGRETEGLGRDRLASGIRPRDDECTDAVGKDQVVRNDRVGGKSPFEKEQGMTQVPERQWLVGPDRRLRRVESGRETPARLGRIQDLEVASERLEHALLSAHVLREHPEDPLDLAIEVGSRHPQPVPDLDHVRGLNENGSSAR